MKNNFDSVREVIQDDQMFIKFVDKQILSKQAMYRIRGGDGGVSQIIIPPPPKP